MGIEKNNSGSASAPLTNRRGFLKTMTAASLALIGGKVATSNAGAWGQYGYITVQGAELFAHPTNLTPLLYMDQGVAVDMLFGPYEGLYQVRYYGTDGWVWADYVTYEGQQSTTAKQAPAAAAAAEEEWQPAASGEHWIDVNRSSGYTRLMIGNQEIAGFWASLSRDQSNSGYYATAIGTYYIYEFRKHLHYTSYADNYITHWIGFDTERFNGFHSYTKDGNGHIVPNGAGFTAGCVALGPNDVDQLWDFAQMGMRVEVHW